MAMFGKKSSAKWMNTSVEPYCEMVMDDGSITMFTDNIMWLFGAYTSRISVLHTGWVPAFITPVFETASETYY